MTLSQGFRRWIAERGVELDPAVVTDEKLGRLLLTVTYRGYEKARYMDEASLRDFVQFSGMTSQQAEATVFVHALVGAFLYDPEGCLEDFLDGS